MSIKASYRYLNVYQSYGNGLNPLSLFKLKLIILNFNNILWTRIMIREKVIVDETNNIMNTIRAQVPGLSRLLGHASGSSSSGVFELALSRADWSH
jgi:hypothetical protein